MHAPQKQVGNAGLVQSAAVIHGSAVSEIHCPNQQIGKIPLQSASFEQVL